MTPTELILAIEGTPAGAQAAAGLALFSAFAHAALGALQKGRHDPWTSRAVIDVWAAAIALPVALLFVPWPGPFLWAVLAGAWVRLKRIRPSMVLCRPLSLPPWSIVSVIRSLVPTGYSSGKSSRAVAAVRMQTL